jgi:hypothetical protein
MHRTQDAYAHGSSMDEREIRDLSDFCQQWTGLRELVEADDLARSGLSQQQLDVVNWLRELADRVCKFEKFSN